MARRRSRANASTRRPPVDDYEHSRARRTNNPPAGLAHLDWDETPVRKLAYDPHLDPQLIWASKAERDPVEVPAPSIHVHEELSAHKIVGSVRRHQLQPPLFDIEALDPAKRVEFYQHDLDWSNRVILGDSLVVLTSLLDRERTPFIWTKTAEEIFTSLQRLIQRINGAGHQLLFSQLTNVSSPRPPIHKS